MNSEESQYHTYGDINIGRVIKLKLNSRERNFDGRDYIECIVVGYFNYSTGYTPRGFEPDGIPMHHGDRIYALEELEKVKMGCPRLVYYRSAIQLFGSDNKITDKEQKEEDEKEMSNLTEIVCPNCGSKLEVYWYADAGTSIIACSNGDCNFMTEIGNKEINSAFYEQYYNKMKYKEDLQREMELRHG